MTLALKRSSIFSFASRGVLAKVVYSPEQPYKVVLQFLMESS